MRASHSRIAGFIDCLLALAAALPLQVSAADYYVAMNGNVDGFQIIANKVHDNNNIGIDAIGFEGVSSDPVTDQARNGLIAQNLVYNINSYSNPAYGTDRSADGIYIDGGRDIVIERNRVHHNNIGIELASEHKGKSTRNVTVRNNFVYLNDVIGITLGGYDRLRGSTENCVIVNNTLLRNDRLRCVAVRFAYSTDFAGARCRRNTECLRGVGY